MLGERRAILVIMPGSGAIIEGQYRMKMKFKKCRFTALSVVCALSACSGGESINDGRYENRNDLPSVLIRDLEVYKLVGGEEYVRVPISETPSRGDAEKAYEGGTDKISFDIVLYYRGGDLYYKALGGLARDEKGQLQPADFDVLKSAVDKTSSIFFEIGFTSDAGDEDQFLPLRQVYVEPSSYSRILQGKDSLGKDLVKFEYTGVISGVAPSVFEQIDKVDVKWNDVDPDYNFNY